MDLLYIMMKKAPFFFFLFFSTVRSSLSQSHFFKGKGVNCQRPPPEINVPLGILPPSLSSYPLPTTGEQYVTTILYSTRMAD